MEKVSLLHSMSRENLPERVDLQKKDGDPRKTAYFVDNLMNYHRVVQIWKDFGALEKVTFTDDKKAQSDAEKGISVKLRKETWEERKHMAPEHCLTVEAGCRVLGQVLEEKGLIDGFDLKMLSSVALIHDAGKFLEFNLVSMALIDNPDKEKMLDFIKSQYGLYYLDSEAQKDMNNAVEEIVNCGQSGMRGLIAYDLASRINGRRLITARVNEGLVEIQAQVGHSSCPEMEILLNEFEGKVGHTKQLAVVKLVIHYVDDIVTNPNIIDPRIDVLPDGSRQNALDRRCEQNEKNAKYKDYNLAWPEYSKRGNGETAFQMQKRVGKMVEAKLAELLGIEDPLTLPAIINQKIEKNILDFASKKDR